MVAGAGAVVGADAGTGPVRPPAATATNQGWFLHDVRELSPRCSERAGLARTELSCMQSHRRG